MLNSVQKLLNYIVISLNAVIFALLLAYLVLYQNHLHHSNGSHKILLEEFQRKQQLLKSHITDRSIQFNYHTATTSILEGTISRGDRRLSKVIYQAWLDGAKFDGWSERI